MSSSMNGYLNPAYHDSETLEIDRRPPGRTCHTNPYAREDLVRGGERPKAGIWSGGDDNAVRGRDGGWPEETWIPLDDMFTGAGGSVGQQDHYWTMGPDSQFDGRPSLRLPSASSGSMTMRWRGMTMRRMSMFPDSDPGRLASTEEAIRSEIENEEQDLVKELVALSKREQVQAIRDLPMSFEEKKHIRSKVLAFQSSKEAHLFTCFTDCTDNVSLSLRRCGYSVRSARQSAKLWHGAMKEIGGTFGSGVLSYFVFLKWLLMFNLFSFVVNFFLITIPLLVYNHLPNLPPGVSFRGLEILTGAGYFSYSVLYYGSYSNEILNGALEYNMQLAYFFTIAIYMVLCGLALIFSMASSFKRNFVLADSALSGAWHLLCSWDFSVTNERAVRWCKNNLRVQLKESLSEKAQGDLLTLPEKLRHFGLHFGCWLLSTGLAVGCAASVYYVCKFEEQRTTDAPVQTALQEAETLLTPFVVSLMNLVVPLFYSLFNKFEHYSSQRRQIYALVFRNVLLRMFILGVLCYYWMNVVAKKFSCWESMVGQALYRLVIVDFFFLMLGSLFGEFLSKVVGTRFLPQLGIPEFDIARNVLELIYAQTLAWIGIYFSPLLPCIQILKFLILFYLKKVSLMRNCQPPRRTGRAAQMQTIFIALLFFPFFVGALSVVGYTAWSLTPSRHCGPFRGLNSTFGVVEVWIGGLEDVPGSDWVIWIYRHVVRSEIFYFLCTVIALVIIYIFWQVTQGRKLLISLLRQQIVNEGKDKTFLLEKLQNMQKLQPKKVPKQKNQNKQTRRHSDDPPSGGQSNSNAMVQALLARQLFEEKEGGRSSGGVPVPLDISSSDAVMRALMARQRAERQDADSHQMAADHEWDGHRAVAQPPRYPAEGDAFTQAMEARRRAEDVVAQGPDDPPSSASSVMMQVMQARRRAEEEERQRAAPPSSSALIQAMLARQQAQNEYDDGY